MRRPVLAALLVLAAAVAPPAGAAPVIHAHRGGALELGVPVRPENTLEAFTATRTAFPDTWLELDAVVSKDGVPFVIHDSTLDRTTDCTGAVVEHTAAQIEACRVDVVGVSERLVAAPATPVVRVPRLAAVLDLARRTGAAVNVEIKRIPGDAGYVPGDESFAAAVLDDLRASGIPRERLIVQSFDPTNLETARRLLPGAQLSFLTLQAADALGPALAGLARYDWVSPGSVPSAAFVAQAHALGLKVVPYTLDTTAQVRDAAAAGVDALITDDPAMAHRALGLPGPVATPEPVVPRARVAARTRRVALARGGLVVALDRAVGRVVTVVMRRGRVVVARATVPAGRLGARATLTRRGRALLRAARGPVRLRVSVTGAAAARRSVVLR